MKSMVLPLTVTRSVGWNAATVAIALAAGLAVGLLTDGADAAAPDIAFTMGVMAASLYWSVLLVSIRSYASESARCSALMKAHVRYTLHTSAVAVFGVLAVGSAKAMGAIGGIEEWAAGANAVAFAAFVLFLLRVLAIVASFSDIFDARMSDAGSDQEPKGGPTGKFRWRKPVA